MSVAIPFGAFENVLLENVNKVLFSYFGKLLLSLILNIHTRLNFDGVGHCKQDFLFLQICKWWWPFQSPSNTRSCSTNECSIIFGSSDRSLNLLLETTKSTFLLLNCSMFICHLFFPVFLVSTLSMFTSFCNTSL